MKTIETAIIFPFTLIIMVMIIFLSFDLHDSVLCQAAGYKFLIRNNFGSSNYSSSDDNDISLLEDYIEKYSLSNTDYSVEMSDKSLSIDSALYSYHIEYDYFDKCDLLRKCQVASDLVNTLIPNDEGE